MEANQFNPEDNKEKNQIRDKEKKFEISPTGYGLESVIETAEEENSYQQSKNNNPSCGGL